MPASAAADELGHLTRSFNQMSERLAHMQELEQQLRRRDRLSALGQVGLGIAHEVRNPLGIIRTSTELVQAHATLDDNDARLLRYVVDNGMFGGSFGVTLIGAVVILLGLFIIALASALTRGKHYARVLTTIAMAAEFALAVIALVVDATSYWFEIALMAAAVLTTVVLWVGRGGRYFAHISAQDAARRQTGL